MGECLKQPLVSIITPCYNGERYLDRYFSSVIQQTYQPLELIFINDGSTDRTAEIAARYRPVLEEKGIQFTYLYQENAGQAAALNRGLKLFTGEYLTWPDADDEMTPDCIEKKVAYLQAHPEYEMCICKIAQVQLFDDKSQSVAGLLQRIIPKDMPDNLFEDLLFLKNVYYCPGGYMVRGSAIDRAIPNRDIYSGRGGQNAQILLPIAYNGTYGYLDDVLYIYYIHADSHSHSQNTPSKVISQLENFRLILDETLQRMPDGVYTKYAKCIQAHYLRLCYGNALDSQNISVIRKYYDMLYHINEITFFDWLHYVKKLLMYYIKRKKS